MTPNGKLIPEYSVETGVDVNSNLSDLNLNIDIDIDIETDFFLSKRGSDGKNSYGLLFASVDGRNATSKTASENISRKLRQYTHRRLGR